MPPNGVKGFLNDYTLLNKEDTPTPATCQQCEDNNNAVAYCNTCSHICNECLTAHKRFKTFISHEIVSGDKESESESKIQPKKTYYCAVHPEESIKVYCKSCQMLACVYCFVSEHNGHDIRNVDNGARMEVEKTINELAGVTDSKLKEFEVNLKYISSVEKNRAERSAPMKDEINTRLDKLVAKVEETRKQLLKEVDDAFAKDLKELWAQKEYHETAISRIKDAQSFTRRALACKEDTELLAFCAQVISRLKELSQLKWNIQETEIIAVTSVKWTPETSDKVNVGKLSTHYSTPTIRIEPVNRSRTFRQEEWATFKVTTTFASTHNFKPRGHHNLKLSVSASCTGSRNVYSNRTQQFTENVSVQVAKSQNEWTSSFCPPSGTTSITLNLTASGQYGQQPVSNTQSFYLHKTY